tara:strand:+ start:8449 stop:9093 length:645 start_codon:yes stop_codon:yes gene_type:complete
MSRPKIYILGAGGQARVNISLIKESNEFDIGGIFDLSFAGIDEEILGAPVLGGIEAFDSLIKTNDSVSISIAIGENLLRQSWFEKIQNHNIRLPNLISKYAYVDPSVTDLGIGNVLSPFSHLGPCSVLGNNNIINTRSNIEHESIIGSHSHLAPHSVVLGRCIVGSNVFIGANSTILPSINITDDVKIGANSLVASSITKTGTYLGVPAKLRKN